MKLRGCRNLAPWQSTSSWQLVSLHNAPLSAAEALRDLRMGDNRVMPYIVLGNVKLFFEKNGNWKPSSVLSSGEAGDGLSRWLYYFHGNSITDRPPWLPCARSRFIPLRE